MKHILSLTLIICICFFSQCKKEKQNPPPDNPYGLPNATQEGKNTLGFLLNGVAWTPAGFNGTANLSIDFDEGVNNGVMGIAAYRIISNDNRQFFGIGFSDSLNFVSVPTTVNLSNTSAYRIRFTSNLCSFFSTDSDTNVTGSMTITKLDRNSRIISGIFSATLSKIGCDVINITEGRFDMSF